MKRRPTQLQTVVVHSPLDQAVALALAEISQSDNTRAEYRRDFDRWHAFCRAHEISPLAPPRGTVVSWIEAMKRHGDAPKSRARRISALASIYRELRRREVVTINPFSVDDGPRREKAPVLEPTPLPDTGVIRKALATCDETPIGLRDAAIIRVLWGTGMRRISLFSMTTERLQRGPDGLIATVIKKGGETQRVLIRGHAKLALDRWMAVLREGGFAKGPIWRTRAGTEISARELGRMLERRAKGTGGTLSPHMLRVAFLTHNPAPLEARQDAAGHADPKTTQIYDRTSWRGREAFEQMPEIEEIE